MNDQLLVRRRNLLKPAVLATCILFVFPVLVLAQASRSVNRRPFSQPNQARPQLPALSNLYSRQPGPIRQHAQFSTTLSTMDPIFLSTPTYNSGAMESQWVAVGDVNGDGVPDVVVATSQCPDSY